MLLNVPFSNFFTLRAAPRDGAYVYGIFMEGARWDITQSVITDSKLKELYPSLPVINIRVREIFKLSHFYIKKINNLFVRHSLKISRITEICMNVPAIKRDNVDQLTSGHLILNLKKKQQSGP